jgi:hypothetical protein
MFSKNNIPLPLFKWNAKSEFDGISNKIDTNILPGADRLSNLSKFTIRTEV